MSVSGDLSYACARLIVGKVAAFELSAEEKKNLRSGYMSGITLF